MEHYKRISEKASVNIFKKEHNDREKVRQACRDFACEPWIAIYVEASDSADIFLTSLDNYDTKYRGNTDKAVEDWKMGENYRQQYARDPNVRHLRLKFESESWKW